MQVNDTEFHASVLSSDQPVLVDFWASWCPPCKMMEPMVDRLTDQLADRVRVVKVNVDRNPVTAANYKIQNLPTFVLFQNGQEVARRTGAQTENQLRALADLAGAPRADAQAPEIVVVTGLPRAGARLMTRLLEAGGVPSHTSHDAEDRGSKAANAVRAIKDAGWLEHAAGKCVSMAHRLVRELPASGHYRVLMMRRHLPELMDSQRRMLERHGVPITVDDATLGELFRAEMASFLAWAEAQPHLDILQVSFNDLMTDTPATLARVARFLNHGLDTEAMARRLADRPMDRAA